MDPDSATVDATPMPITPQIARSDAKRYAELAAESSEEV